MGKLTGVSRASWYGASSCVTQTEPLRSGASEVRLRPQVSMLTNALFTRRIRRGCHESLGFACREFNPEEWLCGENKKAFRSSNS